MDSIIERQREIVARHIRAENEHDWTAVYDTFVQDDRAHYDVMPLGAVFKGMEGVRGFYQSIAAALPDLRIDVLYSLDTVLAILNILEDRDIGAALPWLSRGLAIWAAARDAGSHRLVVGPRTDLQSLARRGLNPRRSVPAAYAGLTGCRGYPGTDRGADQ